MNRYKLPWHVRQFVKQELNDYNRNKQRIAMLKGNTKSLILANERINQIEKVFDSLNAEDREVAEIIFINHYSQKKAEIEKGLSYWAYYNGMNKILYLTAEEMELI